MARSVQLGTQLSMQLSRRRFLAAGGGAAVVAAVPSGSPAVTRETGGGPHITGPGPHITWTVYSRHLQWLTTQASAHARPYETGILIGQTATQLGFSAVDLTVRAGGFVEPAMVSANLGPMVEGIRDTGSACRQITAGITDLTSPFALDILRAASKSGITVYRFGNYRYTPAFGRGVLDELASFRIPLAELEEANRGLGLKGLYYTFSGGNVGASIWDIMWIFSDRRFDPGHMAIDYASAHVIAEGAAGSWQTDLRYALPYVGGISLGDTILVQSPGAAFDTGAFPGTGIVNWTTFFSLLLQGGFNGPLSELFEYPLNGISLNNTWWADTLPASLTTAQLKSTMASALGYYKTQATAAGWSADQQT
jgi:hypothetical protein